MLNISRGFEILYPLFESEIYCIEEGRVTNVLTEKTNGPCGKNILIKTADRKTPKLAHNNLAI